MAGAQALLEARALRGCDAGKGCASLSAASVSLTVVAAMSGCSGGAPTDPTSTPMSDEELFQRVVAEANSSFMGLDEADLPEVQLVRWVTPSDWAQAQVDCMDEAGYSGGRVGQGGIEYPEVPEEQAKALEIAAYVCALEYPTDPRINDPMSEETAQLQYTYWVDTVAPCVRELGVAVEEPPTFEVWYTAYAQKSLFWDPYSGAVNDGELLDQVYEECPNVAPGVYPDDLRG